MTFPGLPTETGTLSVQWNANSQRFVNTETGRFVSNLQAIQFLNAREINGTIRFTDSTGRFVPDPASLVYGTRTFNYGEITRTWSPVSFDAYERPAPQSGYYVTIALYRDDFGNLKTATVYNRIGEVLDEDAEKRRIAGAIAKAEGIPLGGEGTDTVVKRAIRLLHWVAQ